MKNTALVAVLLFLYAPFAIADPTVAKPLNCDASPYMRGIDVYKNKTGDKECKENEPAACNNLPPEEVEPGQGKSVCKNIYRKIRRIVTAYETEIVRRCEASNEALKNCSAKKPSSEEFFNCLRDHSNLLDRDKRELAKPFEDIQQKLARLEQRATRARNEFLENKKASMAQGPSNQPGARPIGGASSLNRNCVPPVGEPDDFFRPVPGKPNSEGKLIDEQNDAIKIAQAFRAVAASLAETHQREARDYKARAASMEALAKRARSADPAAGQKNPADKGSKSDITGGSQKSPQQQAGGGAPGGGGKPEGGAADQGGVGATSGTPPSTKANSAAKEDPAKSSATKLGNAPSSKEQAGEKIAAVLPMQRVENSSSGLLGSSTPGLSRSSSRESGKGSGAKAAASKGSSGGGGGLGGGGGDSPCLGKDCQQALGDLKGSQFASVGSLGAGGGGFGSLDSGAGNLDNLFKTDDPKFEGAPGSLEGLSNLDAGMGDSLSGENTETAVASGQEIGTYDDRDLFLRVRSYHLRALKRGLLVGVPKKL